MPHVLVCLGHSGSDKGVDLDDVSNDGHIAFIGITDHIGAGQAEPLVVSLDLFAKVLEALTPVTGLGQLEALSHGPHGSVQDGYAGFQVFGQRLQAQVSLAILRFRLKKQGLARSDVWLARLAAPERGCRPGAAKNNHGCAD